MKCKLTVSINKELIDELEKTRNEKTKYPRFIDNKSYFIEKILIIGLHSYKQKQNFFDTINLNNVNLSKINY